MEESGTLEFLSERLIFDGPVEALHLACHGTTVLLEKEDTPRPLLLFETAAGARDLVDPDRLTEEIRTMPPLVFLSACSTAARGDGEVWGRREGYRELETPGFGEGPQAFVPDPAGVEELSSLTRKDAGGTGSALEVADPFVRQLARHVPNVLGWDGSVYDTDAIAFAEAFYGALSRGETVPLAAALARREVLKLNAKDQTLRRHWHLARVYLGPGGGGRICDPQKPARKMPPAGDTAWLDKEAKLVRVAGPSEFVGRRRAIQAVIRAYRYGAKGVVVHGMGALGKSSLAARVAGRLRKHRTVAVFGSATARTIFEALARAGRQIAARMTFSEGEALRAELGQMTQVIAEDASRFEDIAQSLFARLFDEHPILLVLDDFEQSLAKPRAEVATVTPEGDHAAPVAALLRALSETDTRSRLLVTTRYDFTVPDGAGRDLARSLVRVPLAPMGARERAKQISAKARAGQKEETLAADPKLMREALAAAGGNPGLQDVLTRPILAGEPEQARAAIAAIAAFKADPERVPPPGDDIGDFFQRMAFETYSQALTATEALVLGAATLFQEALPVPRAALAAVAAARGVSAPGPAIDRLLALGLLDDHGLMRAWETMEPTPHLAANPLARAMGTAIPEAEAPCLAAAALPALAKAWQDHESDFPYDSRSVQAARLAVAAEPGNPACLDQAAKAAVNFLYNYSHDARTALALGRDALARLEALDHAPDPVLIGWLVNAAERLGETELQEHLIDRTLARTDLPDNDRGQFLFLRGNREASRGDIAAARASLEAALVIFIQFNEKRQISLTRGKIAYMLMAEGDLAEARRIHEECLPAFEGLGDRREIAILAARSPTC